MAALIFSRRARNDLTDIGDWIARDNPERAITFVNELERACADLLSFPHIYPPAFVRGRVTVRKRTYGNYLIFYWVDRGDIRIVAVRHAARDDISA